MQRRRGPFDVGWTAALPSDVRSKIRFPANRPAERRLRFSPLRRRLFIRPRSAASSNRSRNRQVLGYLQTVTIVPYCCGVMAAKIRIVMKSFMSHSNLASELFPNAKKIGLPESRALYTVLRSPHIDKKSREQFSMHVKKQFVEQKVEAHELRKKYFWLKRLRAPGAQCEIQISFKTRLDKGILKSKLLDAS